MHHVSFIIFKKWHHKTTVSKQILLLVFIRSKFTESSEPRWSGGRRKREQWKINSTFLKTVLENFRSLYILKLAHFHRNSWMWWHNEILNLMIGFNWIISYISWGDCFLYWLPRSLNNTVSQIVSYSCWADYKFIHLVNIFQRWCNKN